jgi:large subunit ribosomal protein L15
MRLYELYPFYEERKARKRLGRGRATGQGCTAGKGHKGQNSRAGGGAHPWFEGGQMPLARRLPKRGFKNLFRVEYAALNIGRLAEAFEGKDSVSLDDIYAKGLVPKGALVKVLGEGEIKAKMDVEAHRFSKSAEKKIADAGGTATALEAEPAESEQAEQEQEG